MDRKKLGLNDEFQCGKVSAGEDSVDPLKTAEVVCGDNLTKNMGVVGVDDDRVSMELLVQ